MANQVKYNDILDNILKENYNECTCPTNLLSSLKIKKPETKSKGCQFGPFCEFSHNCNYEEDKCTCYPKCTCGPDDQISLPVAGVCPEPDCICVGTCLCTSEDSLGPAPDCDRARCICSTCLCRPDTTEPKYNVLPSYFRNTVKNEALKLMSDTKMQQERDEIKQLISEHEENKKKQNEKPQLCVENDTKDKNESDPSPKLEEQEMKPSTSIPVHLSLDPQDKTTQRNTPKSAPETNVKKSPGITKPSKTHKKDKINKRKPPKQISSARIKTSTICSRQSSSKPRPLRMRFIYSGDTDSYGVKLGHKHCMVKPLSVPKHMGWLWNIEDSSKGIRERKPGPPGFIGKSIKNMMKILKNSTKHGDVTHGSHPQSRWKTCEYETEELEPKDEPPLLHIHKKGKVYNITFCPKNSDEDVGPIPIPFTITEKRRGSDTESSESTLEFELHSPKPRRRFIALPPPPKESQTKTLGNDETVSTAPPPTTVPSKPTKRKGSQKSRGSLENKVAWEKQQTHIEKIT